MGGKNNIDEEQNEGDVNQSHFSGPLRAAWLEHEKKKKTPVN